MYVLLFIFWLSVFATITENAGVQEFYFAQDFVTNSRTMTEIVANALQIVAS